MLSHWLLAFLLCVPFTASAEDLDNVSVKVSAPNSLANTHGKGAPMRRQARSIHSEADGNAANRGPPQIGVAPSESLLDTTSSPYPIIGNRRSHIYHRPDCPNYSQVAPHNRVEFNSAAEAAGYRVARNCP